MINKKLSRSELNQNTYETIYSSGKELLEYPDEILVSYLYNTFKKDNSIKDILDIGFGSGRHVILFAKEEYKVAGIETSESAVLCAKKWLEKENLEANLKVGSSYKVDFKDNTFDALLCWGVINSVVEDKKLDKSMKEIKRVLRPNGRLLISLMAPEDVKFRNAELIKDNIYQIGYQSNTYYTRFWNRKQSVEFIKKYSFRMEKIGFVLRNMDFDENIPIAYYTIAARNAK